MLRPSICITDIMSYFLQGNLAGQEELPAGKIIFFLKNYYFNDLAVPFLLYIFSSDSPPRTVCFKPTRLLAVSLWTISQKKKLLNFMGILSDQHHLSFLYEMSLFYCLLHVMQHGSGLLLCAVNEWTHEWIFVFLISCLNLTTYFIIKYLHSFRLKYIPFYSNLSTHLIINVYSVFDLNIYLSCITIIILHNSVSVCSCVNKVSFVCRDGNTNVEMSEVGM